MDLARFVSLLSTKRLRLTRASTYKDDPWEGYCEVTVPEIPEELLRNSPAHLIYRTASDFSAQEFLNAGNRLYVNCWCRWRESMPMWDLYGSRGSGVAITSTGDRLQRAVDIGETKPEQWAHDVIRYHDDIRSAAEIRRDLRVNVPQSGNLWQSVLKLAFQKRDGFEAENEWRAAVYQPHQQTAPGVEMACDLAALIDEVIVGPRADVFVVNVVRDLMSRYELDRPVRQSTLLQGPEPATN